MTTWEEGKGEATTPLETSPLMWAISANRKAPTLSAIWGNGGGDLGVWGYWGFWTLMAFWGLVTNCWDFYGFKGFLKSFVKGIFFKSGD